MDHSTSTTPDNERDQQIPVYSKQNFTTPCSSWNWFLARGLIQISNFIWFQVLNWLFLIQRQEVLNIAKGSKKQICLIRVWIFHALKTIINGIWKQGKVRKERGNKHKRLVPGIQKEPFLTNVIIDKTERDRQMPKTEVPIKRPRERRKMFNFFLAN